MRRRAYPIPVLVAVAIASGCKDEPPRTTERAPTEAPADTRAARSDEGTAAPTVAEEAPGPTLIALGQPGARLKVKAPAPVKYNKAKKAHKDKDLETAGTLLDEALEADPVFAWALLLRARIHIQQGETEACAEMLERLLAYNYIEYAPRIQRVGWLKPFRDDPEAWPAFEQTMESYRKAWVDALNGPGAFFVQSQYKNVQQADPDGAPLDLKWRRGSAMFWSADLGRFLLISEYTDVAAFLHRDDKLVIIRFSTSDESPGMMSGLTAQRLDLSEAQLEGKPVEIAGEAEIARFALDADGNLLFELKLIADEEVDDETDGAEADDEVAVDDEADDEDGEEDDEDDREDEAGLDDEEGSSGFDVGRVNWSKGRVDEGTMSEDDDWLLLVTLLDSDGPPPVSAEDSPESVPVAKRDGVCFFLDAERAFCFEPTKKGGTWTNLYVHLPDSEPANLTADDPIPVVQF